MPGHMNVLVVEADTPDDPPVEMDDIRRELPQAAMNRPAIGANDATISPPAPISQPLSLPALPSPRGQSPNGDVIKRSMKPGFAGIDNPLSPSGASH